jgi:hypothetical protein
MKSASHRLIVAILFFALPAGAAGEPGEADGPGLVEIGTTLTAMADRDSEGNESVMAFDVLTTIPTDGGSWGLLMEAVADPMANASAANARHVPGNGAWGQAHGGQARVAELHYNFTALGGDWSVGLLDSKVHIDGSHVANDDKEQFLGAAFVNNPAIAIPENRLGVAYRHAAGPFAPQVTVMMSASEMTVAESDETVDSLFLALEAAREIGGLTTRLGAWVNGVRRPDNRGFEPGPQDYGLYASVDGHFGRLGWNVRGGTARLGGRAQESFLGAATLIPLRRSVLGFGVGHSVRSGPALTGFGGQTSYLEVFYRFTALDRFTITPDLQYQRISGMPGADGGFAACLRIRMMI